MTVLAWAVVGWSAGGRRTLLVHSRLHIYLWNAGGPTVLPRVSLVAHTLVPFLIVLAIALQEYFTQLAGKKLAHESQDKIRDVMSAVLRSAVDYGLLIRNSIENVQMPRDHRGRRVARPYLTPSGSSS